MGIRIFIEGREEEEYFFGLREVRKFRKTGIF